MENNSFLDKLKSELPAFELYLLYHTDAKRYINKLRDDCSEELLESLSKVLVKNIVNKTENSKYDTILEIILEIVILEQFKKHDKTSKFYQLLETNLSLLLTINKKSYTNFLTENWYKKKEIFGGQFFKIVAVYLKMFFSSGSKFNWDLKSIEDSCILEFFTNDRDHNDLLYIINMLARNNQKRILSEILKKSKEYNNELSLKNLAYFFSKICEEELVDRNSTILEKALKHEDPFCRKLGLYFVKCFISARIFKDNQIKTWQKFVVIMENLDEKQSHLILPTLASFDEINFENKTWTLVLLESILKHENTQVSTWGIQKLLAKPELIAESRDSKTIETLLKSINRTSLYGSDVHDSAINISQLHKFTYIHFWVVLENIEKISWLSVPFYYLLQGLSNSITTKILEDKGHLIRIENFLESQIKFISKKPQNLQIRAGIQILYSEILDAIAERWLKENNVSHRFVILMELVFEFGNCKHAHDNIRKLLKGTTFVSTFQDKESKISESFVQFYNDNISEESSYLNGVNIAIRNLSQISNSESKSNLPQQVLIHLTLLITNKDNVNEEDFRNVREFLKPINIEKLTAGKSTATVLTAYLDILKFLWDFDCEFVEKRILQESLTILEMGNSKSLLCLLDNWRRMFDKIENWNHSKNICSILKKIYKEIMDIRDTYDFFDCFEKFCDLLMPAKPFEPVYWLDSEISFYFNEIMNYSSPYQTKLVYTFYEKYFAFYEKRHDNVSEYIVIAGLLYGENLTKDQKIEADVGRKIVMKKKLTRERLPEDKEVRMMSIIFCAKNQEFLQRIVIKLVLQFLEISKKKPRYFLNSEYHRIKLRCLQPLLFLKLQDQMTLFSETIFEILFKELLEQNNQQSVTYLLEVLLASICSRNREMFDTVLKHLSTANNLKPQAVQSLISVLFLIYQTNKTQLKDCMSQMISTIFTHVMGQNFATRSHAQNFLCCLFNDVKSEFEGSVVDRLKFGILCILSNENLKKDLTKNLIYEFTLDQLLTFDAVFCHIPEITNMSPDEIFEMRHFERYAQELDGSYIADDATKKKFQELKKLMESNIVSNEFEITPCTCRKMEMNFQQKYQIPFKTMVTSKADCLNSPNDLIVVATLVSRPPNLGGLARTAEVFGIKEFVIDSINHTKNFEFKALSKSAEKWLNVTEIKEWQLFDYLLHKKNEGYTIIGAEQTSNSQNIIGTKIPIKSVLLLGHEKEGIPANLLSLLDITIEIPQTGYVRSLNVHVSGALVMWEYAKQHDLLKMVIN